jgi:hypothetical protein
VSASKVVELIVSITEVIELPLTHPPATAPKVIEQLFSTVSKIQTRAAATFVRISKAEHYYRLHCHCVRQVWHDPQRPSVVPSLKLASKRVWSHQGVEESRTIGKKSTPPWSLTQFYIYLLAWKSDSSPSEDKWSSCQHEVEFQTIYRNSMAYTPSIILETQSEFDKIISEEIERHSLRTPGVLHLLELVAVGMLGFAR